MAEPTVRFIKKKSRPTNARKRSPSPSASPAPAASSSSTTSEVVLPTRKAVANPLVQGTKRSLADRDRGAEGPDVHWKSAGSQARAEAGLELALEEENHARSKRSKEDAGDDVPDDGLYRGQTGYKDLIKIREDGVPKAMRVGPVRNTSTIRTVTVIDYQPDVCKDYKGASYSSYILHLLN